MIVIRSTRVVVPSGAGRRSVHVDGEKIDKVSAWEDVPPGATVHDVGSLVVMPGVVDAHVHVNEPGRTEWEGFASATASAAAGGVTTIVDMPLNSIPATTNVAALEQKVACLRDLAVDVGLWGGAVPGNEDDLRPLLDAGVLGFKCFLVDSGVPEFPPLELSDLERTMRVLASCGAPLLVHAELPAPIAKAALALPTDHRTYMRYLASRPREAEDAAIELLVRLCAMHRAHVHVVHLSSSNSLAMLDGARASGLNITAETTPHYLRLEAETIPDGATAFKCAPPIREHENRERLWKGLVDGTIDSVVTDHSPCTPELKRMDIGDFDVAWGGIASLQLGLSVVWTEAHARGIGIDKVCAWMCAAPAKLARLGAKGTLSAGCDADFLVFDPDAVFNVAREGLLHRHTVTPYEGQELRGVVRETWLRGNRVYDAGVLTRGKGKWLKA